MICNRFGISVVIPTYNRKEKLVRAVNSVKATKDDPVEIIVVDDNSDVDPAQYLGGENIHGVSVFIFRNIGNKGPQISRNLGIRRAKYSYVAFLDSDDYFTTEKIEFLLKELQNTRPDFVYHGVLGCEKYNKISSFWFQTIGRFIHFRWFLCFLNPCVTPSVVIKKKTCLFNPGIRYAEDYAFFLSYVDKETIVNYYDEVLSVVPRSIGSEGGVSANFIKMRLGEIVGKKNLLRKDGNLKYVMYIIAILSFLTRVLSDLLRGKYNILELFSHIKW